jgi:hypothetical protein
LRKYGDLQLYDQCQLRKPALVAGALLPKIWWQNGKFLHKENIGFYLWVDLGTMVPVVLLVDMVFTIIFKRIFVAVGGHWQLFFSA